jgi:hypothetical protein
MPCAIHFSGNTEATSCIHVGSWSYWKNTPETNCSTSTIGTTTALADRPDLGTEENATPHTDPVAVPSTNTHAKVSHRPASLGSGTSHSRAAAPISNAVCSRAVTSTCPTLPRKYDAAGSGVPRRRLRAPSSRSTATNVARFWKLDSITPVATMPGRKYWAKLTGPTVPPSRPNTVAKMPSITTGYRKMNATASRSRA